MDYSVIYSNGLKVIYTEVKTITDKGDHFDIRGEKGKLLVLVNKRSYESIALI